MLHEIIADLLADLLCLPPAALLAWVWARLRLGVRHQVLELRRDLADHDARHQRLEAQLADIRRTSPSGETDEHPDSV